MVGCLAHRDEKHRAAGDLRPRGRVLEDADEDEDRRAGEYGSHADACPQAAHHLHEFSYSTGTPST